MFLNYTGLVSDESDGTQKKLKKAELFTVVHNITITVKNFRKSSVALFLLTVW